MRIALPALTAALLLSPAAARGADALGLDLSSGANKDASLGLDLSEKFEGDFTQGARVVAIPPLRASDGRPDLVAFRLIHEALSARLGERFVGLEATVKAIEEARLRGPAVTTSEGITKIAVSVKAPRVLLFTFEKGFKLTAVALSKPSAMPTRQNAWPWTKKTDLAVVKGWMDLFLMANRDVLLPPPQPKQEPVVAQVAQEGVGDTENEVSREAERAKRDAQSAMEKRPMAMVLVGAGATLRDFTARTSRPIVPQAQGPMTGFSVDLALYPFRMIEGMKDVAGGKLNDFSFEGHYRRTFANARFGGTDPSLPPACGVEDDETIARAAYRYDFGGPWPRVGISFGMAWERALMKCDEPVLSTRYNSTELHLKILQPIVGEQLQLELSGGPRFLVSTRAAGNADRAFSAEAWVVGHPVEYFYVRGGGRWTNTRLRTYPEGIAITDIRYFVGLEVGAAL
ncbi:MAG: hypothetical protein QM765_26800 [Myxococcales bacterium]